MKYRLFYDKIGRGRKIVGSAFYLDGWHINPPKIRENIEAVLRRGINFDLGCNTSKIDACFWDARLEGVSNKNIRTYLSRSPVMVGDRRLYLRTPNDTCWCERSLAVESDPPHRAKYRLLQSWYRQTVLGLPPGFSRLEATEWDSPVGSMLPVELVSRNPAWNFIDPSIAEYAIKRLKEIRQEDGTVDGDRLMRNMLSSMPLCFNLFGYLRAHKDAAAKVLSRVLELDIAAVTDIEIEWSPPRAFHLNDRTAFDAIVRYKRSDGLNGFLAIETKYTEPFSRTVYESERYEAVTRAHREVFAFGSEVELRKPLSNQLWRNSLLALSLCDREGGECRLVAMFCDGDPVAGEATKVFSRHLMNPSNVFKPVTFEAFIDECKREAELAEWAHRFEKRYLNLTPILRRINEHRSIKPSRPVERFDP